MKHSTFLLLFGLGLVAGVFAQEHELNIHGETPLPERLAVWADEAVRPMRLDALDQGAIPINISLDEPGYVTLVIEDSDGVRVRNLVSERFFEAGNHVVYWDGLDESGVPDATQGAYSFYPNFVRPGGYQVRGLVRGPVDLRWELAVNNAGNPPWSTSDGRGGWLADHMPPSALVLIPGEQPRMLIGSAVAESGHGLVWTNLKGEKIAGTRSVGVGGGWCGAHLLARDSAAGSPEAYLTVAWQNRIELWSINPNRDVLGANKPGASSVQGIAVRNGLAALSLDESNELMLIDVRNSNVYSRPSLERPRGLVFDDAGRLLVISGDRLLRFNLPSPTAGMQLPAAEVVIANGLEDASQMVIDDQGRFFIGFHGKLHQVRVFSRDGRFLHAIGEPGGARLGAYDPRRMDKPTGLAIAPDGKLWVAENSFSPKRISIWSLDGELVKWMVGPPQYGGGGSLSADKKRFYYGGQGQAGLEFAVDWEAGTAELANIYFLSGGPGDIGVHPGGGNWHNLPQHPLNLDGREYMTNAWNSHATRSVNALTIWQRREGIAIPVAAIGPPSALAVLNEKEFQERRNAVGNEVFVWSDLNDDGKIQPNEVTFTSTFDNMGPLGQFSIRSNLELINANGLALRPRGLTAAGAPIYDAANAELLVEELMSDVGAAGGAEPILSADGHVIVTGGPMRGFRNGKLVWTYPSRWPSLDASHWQSRERIGRIASPSPGLMVGTTHLCGPTVRPTAGEAGELWAINSNVGSTYLMTTDGLFVATLFPDVRLQQLTDVPAERGTLVNDRTPGAESFWTSINQTDDREIYLVAEIGTVRPRLTQSNVIHIDGLQSVRRLPASPFTVTPAHLEASWNRIVARAAAEIDQNGRRVYRVPISSRAHAADGDLREWPAPFGERNRPQLAPDRPGGWVQLGELPYHHRWWPILGAVRIADNTLHLAIAVSRFCHALDGLEAAAADPVSLLTDASAVEIALTTNPAADETRMSPADGDIRVVVSMHNGKPLAMVYHGAVSQSRRPLELPVAWGETVIGGVTDISRRVEAGQTGSIYEVAIPLDALGIDARPGVSLRADFGLVQRSHRVLDSSGRKLRVGGGTTGVEGHDERVSQRIYWHNKATTVATAGPGGNAVFLPQLWGTWQFVRE